MRVAIVGLGLQGKRRISAIKDSGDELIYVVDKDIRLAESIAARLDCTASKDWHEAVADRKVETVVVCTPSNLHAEICIAALKSNKHVLCEKPLARTPREALQILRVARSSKAKLKCGFNLRYHPALGKAKELVDKGAVGKVTHLRCRYGISGRLGYENDWRMDPSASGGGQLMDQGIHVMDLFRWFAGDFTRVFGFVANAHWKTMPVEDNAFGLLRTRTGQIAMLHVSWTEWKNLFSFEVFGGKGYIKVEGLGGSYGNESLSLGLRSTGPFRAEVTEFRGEDKSWLNEWRHFSHCIEQGTDFGGNAFDGWAAIRLAHAVYKASKTGNSVRMNW